MDNIHSGHKQRLRERFLREPDFAGFSEHEILELILSYALVRTDTNKIAHKLINEFGSLNDVLQADIESLCRVDGIGERTAVFINMQYNLLRYYNYTDACGSVNSSEESVLQRLVALFSKLSRERLYLAVMSGPNKIESIVKIAEGTSTTVITTPRQIVAECIKKEKVSEIILAHNHPNGIVVPSQEDIEFTRNIINALKAVDVRLAEHYIISGNEYYPLIKYHLSADMV